MTRTIHFNTGRKYTVHGQRITATLHDDGVVTFYDHDRSVDGQYTPDPQDEFTRSQVMFYYDQGLTPNTERSWRDGLLRGGVNSKYEEQR